MPETGFFSIEKEEIYRNNPVLLQIRKAEIMNKQKIPNILKFLNKNLPLCFAGHYKRIFASAEKRIFILLCSLETKLDDQILAKLKEFEVNLETSAIIVFNPFLV
ncbi:hypothetical protein MHBO_001161 [Bonamia ostreae]|uniref:Uncharacterized protein n=1 Tax=Bonamia ostreae TaxID=126728 RepID=A0ABV2AI06_9EUKA